MTGPRLKTPRDYSGRRVAHDRSIYDSSKCPAAFVEDAAHESSVIAHSIEGVAPQKPWCFAYGLSPAMAALLRCATAPNAAVGVDHVTEQRQPVQSRDHAPSQA